MTRLDADVLVIGGGGAGLMAASEASRHGVRVAVVLKGQRERSGATIMAPGAVAGVGSWGRPGDDPDLHFRDTVVGGAFMNEQRLVRLLVDEAPERIVELERMGALWERAEDGRSYLLRIDGGHSFHRCVYLEDRTGREMVRTLGSVLARRHVPVYENIMITRLLVDQEGVFGAVGVDLTRAEPLLLQCRALVLATGGAGNVYQNTDCPTDVTGDGYALALEAGAQLMDMEFVQFYPIGFLHPPSLRGVLAGLLYYSHLLNSRGERFMERYDPERLELSTRDRVARAIVTEVAEGRGSPRGGVYCDMRFQPPGFIARQTPALYRTYRQIGLDPEKDMIEVAPTAHFFMGGLMVDEDWAATVPGLFAAGEVAAGVHGANRLSQNALAELLVSGVRAGRSAARHARDARWRAADPGEVRSEGEKVRRLLASNGSPGPRPWQVREQLRQIMWQHVGVIRNAQGLEAARRAISRLRGEVLPATSLATATRLWNADLRQALENEMLLSVAECVLEGAARRTESRGAHYRSDYPDTDNAGWLRHVVLQRSGDGLRVSFRPTDLSVIKPEGM
ncbi:MAG: FAD-binding protein [Bacillota bacterium]|nr:FAD-binding protein [Bacillota bacterium]